MLRILKLLRFGAGGSDPIACYLQFANTSVVPGSLGHNQGFWITGLRGEHGHYDRGRNTNLVNARIQALASALLTYGRVGNLTTLETRKNFRLLADSPLSAHGFRAGVVVGWRFTTS